MDATDAFSKDGKKMMAVPIALIDPVTLQWIKWKVFYIHADSPVQAKIHFQTVFPDRRRYHIIDAAPCIGWFVDKKGKIVTTD